MGALCQAPLAGWRGPWKNGSVAQVTSEALADGSRALRRGDWTAARDCFQAALETERSGQAWDGLAWAAWWLCDEEQDFEAREKAYRAYRAAGDDCSAARAAAWLAGNYMDYRGEHAVAIGWLERARRLLAGNEACAEAGFVSLIEADVLAQMGEPPSRVEAVADHAVGVGRELGVNDLVAVGLALKGRAVVSQGRVEEGIKLLDEASASASGDDFELPLSPAWALCCVITGCEGVGDYPRAAQWCGAMVATGERWQGRYMTGMCRSAYGSILATQGDWPAADAALVAAVDAMQATRPPMAGGGLARLGELRARQGRRDEAAELFRQAGAHPLGLVGLGNLALEAGDAAGAADAAERVLRRLPEGAVLDRFPALELLAGAKSAQGEIDAAGAACDELAETAAALSTPYLKGRARLAAGAAAVAAGDHEQARRLCEDAIDLFAESAAPYDQARTRVVLADALRALGRDEPAAAERVAADEAFRRLGAAGPAPTAGGTPGEPGELTARELEVLRLVAGGMGDAEVADRLVVSPHTVHRHVANVRMKLGLPSRAAAVAYAARENLL